MTDTLTYGGWVTGHHATGAPASMTKIVSWVATAAAVLATIGTGGEVLPAQFQRPVSHTQAIGTTLAEVSSIRSPLEDLARIREVLSPAISDLATTFGVARQSIYNWLNGETVAQENAIKLRDLAQAADLLAHENIPVNSMLLKRKFAKGMTLLQLAQAGESTREAASLLIQIIKRESAQRSRMDARFASRTKTPATADFDLPAASEQLSG